MRHFVEDTLYDRVFTLAWPNRRVLVIHGNAIGPDQWCEPLAAGLGFTVRRYLPNGRVSYRRTDGVWGEGAWLKHLSPDYYDPIERNKAQIRAARRYANLGAAVFVAGFVDSASKKHGTARTLEFAAQAGLWHYDFVGRKHHASIYDINFWKPEAA